MKSNVLLNKCLLQTSSTSFCDSLEATHKMKLKMSEAMGFAQQELCVLTIFLLVFTHVNGMTSPVRN